MLQDGALIESLPHAAAAAEEIRCEQAGREGDTVAAVTRRIEMPIGGREVREDGEPEPEQQNNGSGLKRDKERFNATNALRNHEKW